MKNIKNYTSFIKESLFDSKYDKQTKGKFIEVYFMDELVAEFEMFDSGVFVGSDYTHNFDPIKYEDIYEISKSYKINDEFKPDELFDMLDEWSSIYPELNFVGLELAKENN